MALTYSQARTMLRTINGNNSSNPIYIGLSRTAPGRSGNSVDEPPAEAGYRRVRLASNAMTDPANGSTHNQDTIYFAEATGDWGVCTYFCLFSSQSASHDSSGNDNSLLAFGALPNSVHPTGNETSGTVPLIRAGNLVMTL